MARRGARAYPGHAFVIEDLEHMARLAEMKRGVPRSDEVKAKISAAKVGQASHRKGAVLSAESKALISANRAGKAVGPEHGLFRHDISTEVIVVAVASGKTKVQIAKELGVSPTFVHRRLKQAKFLLSVP